MEYCFRPVFQDAATIMDECEADLQDQEPSTVCPIEDAFSDQVDNLFDQSFGDIFCSDLKEGVKEDKGKALEEIKMSTYLSVCYFFHDDEIVPRCQVQRNLEPNITLGSFMVRLH